MPKSTDWLENRRFIKNKITIFATKTLPEWWLRVAKLVNVFMAYKDFSKRTRDYAILQGLAFRVYWALRAVPVLTIPSLFMNLLREAFSGSESFEMRDWRTKNCTLGWGSFWEWVPVVSWFSTSMLRDVPGAVPESVRTCRFKRNSSNLDRAPKIRDPVLLNAWESF